MRSRFIILSAIALVLPLMLGCFFRGPGHERRGEPERGSEPRHERDHHDEHERHDDRDRAPRG